MREPRLGIQDSYQFYGQLSVDCKSLPHNEYSLAVEFFPTWNRPDTTVNVESTSVYINK